MTTPPSLRDRAIDAVGLALNAARYWLPVEGRPIAVDAVLALVNPATCCVCGGGPVTYRNYREQPFCWPCADCQCGENPCGRTGVNDPAVSATAEPTARTIADAFEVPLHLIDTTQPAEHCGTILRSIWDQPPTECVLRPGHQGSHADHHGARWVETPAAGYCPHCGRGDAGPTADQYEQQRKRAEQAEGAFLRFRGQVQAIADEARGGIRQQLGHALAALEPPKETPDA
ncbi:hypothetical protein ACODT3_10655 [Streptomyces sp. 4.24]|uniref:hypothetical protein n=1 Tax=Streptomyces tritrimontium TaxID=3406573 RepID=UPI003BB59C60